MCALGAHPDGQVVSWGERPEYCRGTGVCSGGRDVSCPGYCRGMGLYPGGEGREPSGVL